MLDHIYLLITRLAAHERRLKRQALAMLRKEVPPEYLLYYYTDEARLFWYQKLDIDVTVGEIVEVQEIDDILCLDKE